MIASPKIADLAALRSLISQRAPAAQTGIGVAEQLRQRGIAVIGQAEEALHRCELQWRNYVRRAVAPPSLDYCR